MTWKDTLGAARDKTVAALDRATTAVSTSIDTATDAVKTVTAAISETADTATSAIRSAGSRTRTATLMATALAIGLVQPVLAQPDGCNPPADIQPVFDLLEAITEVTMMGGLTIAALGIAIGGVFFMWPGQDMNRRAKSIITYTIIGTVVILTAHAIVAFVTAQMAGPVC